MMIETLEEVESRAIPESDEDRRWNEWRLARLALVSDEPLPSKNETCCLAGKKVDYDSSKQCCSKSLTPESQNFGSELVDRFKICITANGDPGTSPSETGHAWITITNLATGKVDTWGNWKSGARSVGHVGESGLQSGNELKPRSYESNYEKDHSKFSRRCKYICGFELSRAIGGGFRDLTNNCSTYAAEQWKFSTGESLSAGKIFDSPGDLRVSIANANK
jgi:hypothetical protein